MKYVVSKRTDLANEAPPCEEAKLEMYEYVTRSIKDPTKLEKHICRAWVVEVNDLREFTKKYPKLKVVNTYYPEEVEELKGILCLLV